MVYGELGQYPLSINIKLRMVEFWIRLNRSENKISSILCKLLYVYYHNYGYENKWICFVKSIFDNCGMSNIWQNTDIYSKEWIINSLRQKLKDQYLQEWFSEVNTSPKSLCYKIFKTEFKFENYLSILPLNFLFIMCKFRCSNHRLPVETGRWHNIPRAERLCHRCGSDDIGDEFHYILTCNALNEERRKYLSSYYTSRANTIIFCKLMTSSNNLELEKLCKFIRCISSKIAPPG